MCRIGTLNGNLQVDDHRRDTISTQHALIDIKPPIISEMDPTGERQKSKVSISY